MDILDAWTVYSVNRFVKNLKHIHDSNELSSMPDISLSTSQASSLEFVE